MSEEWVVVEPGKAKTAAGKVKTTFRLLTRQPHRSYAKALAEAKRLDPSGQRDYRVWKHVTIPKEPGAERVRRR